MKGMYNTTPVLVLFITIIGFVFHNSTTYQVTGLLTDMNDNPVTNHRVFLYGENDELMASAHTDFEGYFTLAYQIEPTSADPGTKPDGPTEFKLGSSYPNPFNPKTIVPFESPENTNAHITVYNILGQEVMRTQANINRGSHEILLNLGGNLSQGQYLIRVQGDGYSLTRAMTFLSAGVSSGSPGITVRPAGNSENNILGSIRHSSETLEYRVVVEECDAFHGKEFLVPADQDYNTGTKQLVRRKHNVDITIDGQGSVNEHIVTAKDYEHGTLVRLTAIPDEGWRFVEWSGDVTDTDNVIYVRVDEEKSVTATFVIREYPLDIAIEGEGTVQEEVLSAKTYEHGTLVRLTAVPAEGWRFVEWSGDLDSTNPTVEITVEGEKSITATFEKRQYPLNITIAGKGSVNEQVITAKSYEHGTLVRLTAMPAEGWRFVEWSGDLDSTNPTVEITVVEEKNITVTFEKRQYPVNITTVGEGSVSEQIITAKSYEHGTLLRLTAIPAEGWRFVEWSGDVTDADNVIYVRMDEEKSVTATFVIREYPLDIAIEGEGTVQEEVLSAKSYEHGTLVRLTAIPAEDWFFEGWKGALEGQENPQTLLIDEDKEVTATFIPLPPIVTTLDVSNVTLHSATAGGVVTSEGGKAVDERGICYAITENPDLEDNCFQQGDGIGEFSVELTGLEVDLTYYVRAYAKNDVYTVYGDQVSFKTYYDLVTDIDGNEYITVLIGTQEWMAENLRVTRYLDGTDIPTGLTNTQWEAASSGAFAVYPHPNMEGPDSPEEVARAYGKLYNWHAVNDARGLCPAGWRVPTQADWQQLTNDIGGTSSPQGNMLKSRRQVDSPLGAPWATEKHPRWDSHGSLNGTDDFGFSGLPGGERGTNGSFDNIGVNAYWWTRTETSETSARVYSIHRTSGGILSNIRDKRLGYSIRCIRVDEAEVHTLEATDVTTTTASSGGEIVYEGISAITERGVVWSTEENPTVENHDGMTTDGAGAGKFESNLTGLELSTTYYLRAYATNEAGTFYGDQTALTTLSVFDYGSVTDIDGNEYKTIQIYTQEWMAENLRVTRYLDGTDIATGLSNTQWEVASSGAFAVYPHSTLEGLESPDEVAGAYGKLYNWHAVNDARGLCPAGWRVPTQADWDQLTNDIGGTSSPYGNMLKSRRQVDTPLGAPWATEEHPRWDPHSTQHATDDFGFSALPGGLRSTNGSFSDIGYHGYWWSRTETSETRGRGYSILGRQGWPSGHISSSTIDKRVGYSIRCIRIDEAEVHTLEATDITATSARSGGDIVYEGISAITGRGVVWSTEENPTIENHDGMTTDGTGAGQFESNPTGLEPATTYYLRAYATNEAGTFYGGQFMLTTLSVFDYGSVSDIDGNEYKTIQIYTQEWMAENLRVTRYRDGTDIPTGLSNTQWEAASSAAFAVYPHSTLEGLESPEDVAGAYGKLYNWHAVNDTRGLCPVGWRVPTQADWQQLTNDIGGTSSPHGNMLKSRRQVNSPFGAPWATEKHPRWSNHSNYGTDDFGFSALPGGRREISGSFGDMGNISGWWSQTENNETTAITYSITRSLGNIYVSNRDKRAGYSVRCIRE